MLTGLESLVLGGDFPYGERVGLLMNRASVDQHLRLTCDVFDGAFPDRLAALLAPQHGFWGDAQANMIESDHDVHVELGIPIYSLYSETRQPTERMLKGLDCLVIDLQDVGTRVYTFAWTMLSCLQACADAGVSILVLDRPNPIGGEFVEGPLLDAQFQSFVGGATIPMRHGLTIGELARLISSEQNIRVNLNVIPMVDWEPVKNFGDNQRLWIPPSPNLPTVGSTLVYPGQVLLEGTNLSEGRGTTTPFEVVGAPFVDPELIRRILDRLDLPGVRFLPIRFRPTFDKWAGMSCGGVSLHVTDATHFRPYRTTLAIIASIQETYPRDFRWLDPPYEYENEKPPIDIISGSDRVRVSLSTNHLDSLCELDSQGWQTRVSPALLYRRERSGSNTI